jgi:hypothetical protein
MGERVCGVCAIRLTVGPDDVKLRCVSPARDPSTTMVPSKPTQRVPSGGVLFGSYPVAGSKTWISVTWAVSAPLSTIESVSPRLPGVGPTAPLGVDSEPPGRLGMDPDPFGAVAPHAASTTPAAPMPRAVSTLRERWN